MSDSKLQSIATELTDTEREYLETLSRDAAELLAAYSQDVNLRRNRSARRCAFAAYEAIRDDSTARVHDLLYTLFILLSVVAALVIGFTVPRELKSLVWDTWGLASTLLLLILTYGTYVFLTFWHEVQSAIKPGRVPEKDQNTTAGHVLLCLAGALFTWNAGQHLFYILLAKRLQDVVACNKSYAWFIFWVCCLALLFVAMDYWVAVKDDSHNETFIAASSFVHSTIPMAIGVVAIGLYMFCDYRSLIHQGKNSSEALVQLPVEFASGAMSFQMIMSNTLFAFIKRNAFLRFAYFATGFTKSL
jgi:hypothetical protein